jgi:hypothetical protein
MHTGVCARVYVSPILRWEDTVPQILREEGGEEGALMNRQVCSFIKQVFWTKVEE